MNIVQPYARLVDLPDREAGVKLLRKIEWCGRISHRSEEAQTEDSWERFITGVVLGHGDWSIVEHASATVDMTVDRGITHEWVRHRLFSFTQESTRFVNYEKKMPPSFILPAFEPSQSLTDELSLNAKRDLCHHAWLTGIEAVESAYKALIACGEKPQIARSVFPNALASRIITTGNLRVWRHVFCMRSCKEAHPQMRQVILPLLEEFKAKIPLLYDDIIPMSRQIDNMRLPQ
jgi:thymidylate synthase (FAD)